MKTFHNKVVWLTGASSGIGEALAYALSGKCKLILSSRNREELERVKRCCAPAGDAILIIPFDLTITEELPLVASVALNHWGRVDCFIHNAGIAVRDLAVKTKLQVDREVMETNYFGPMFLTKCILPKMLERREGHIAVVSSLSGKYGVPKLSAYAASKHALHGFFDSLRTESESMNVKISMIVPGFIKTPIADHAKDGSGQLYGKKISANDHGMSVDECARKIIDALLKEKEEALIGGTEMLSVYFHRFFPKLFSRVIRNHPLRRLQWQ